MNWYKVASFIAGLILAQIIWTVFIHWAEKKQSRIDFLYYPFQTTKRWLAFKLFGSVIQYEKEQQQIKDWQKWAKRKENK